VSESINDRIKAFTVLESLSKYTWQLKALTKTQPVKFINLRRNVKSVNLEINNTENGYLIMIYSNQKCF
jgi:hypothetical protein